MPTVKERKESFIKRANEIYNNKYDYSQVNYVNNTTPVKIKCPIHGFFEKSPNNHIHKTHPQGCPHCAVHRHDKYTPEELQSFLENKFDITFYDFSRIKDYNNREDKVEVHCQKHGWFKTTINLLLKGYCCRQCGIDSRAQQRIDKAKNEFVEKARKVHGDKYDYSKVDYKRANVDVTIICPKHGEFQITPNEHLSSNGCKQCGIEERANKQRMPQEEAIRRFKEVHGDLYDYSEFKYHNYFTESKVFCKKHQQYFSISPRLHLIGCGCPSCNNSHLENEMRLYLERNGLKYIQQYNKGFGLLRLDFYLPDYNLAIECQGLQHFKPVVFSSEPFDKASESFVETQKRDEMKFNLCQEQGIKIVYYTSTKVMKCVNKNNIVLPSFYNETNLFDNLNFLSSFIEKII